MHFQACSGAAGWDAEGYRVSYESTVVRSDLLARSREIRRLRVIAGAVLDDQLTRLCSGLRGTEGHANRALRFGV